VHALSRGPGIAGGVYPLTCPAPSRHEDGRAVRATHDDVVVAGKRRLIRIVLAGLLALVVSSTLASASPAASCTVSDAGGLPGPDSSAGCTPGSFERLSKAAVCRSKRRPDTPASVRHAVLTSYGVPSWTGRDGEIDHRVPFFLGGLTDRANLWPERGAIPNEKDRLESYVYRRVCQREPSAMRVATARGLFLGDWRRAYRRYHLDR
jgi:hypothetical protein